VWWSLAVRLQGIVWKFFEGVEAMPKSQALVVSVDTITDSVHCVMRVLDALV